MGDKCRMEGVWLIERFGIDRAFQVLLGTGLCANPSRKYSNPDPGYPTYHKIISLSSYFLKTGPLMAMTVFYYASYSEMLPCLNSWFFDDNTQ